MSLTFPSAYEYGLKNVHAKENWLLHLYYYDGADRDSFLALSDRDITVSSVQYYGLVTDWGEITESINLAESKGSVSDTTIECSNVLKNGKLTDELYGGTNKYLNCIVKIYSQVNDVFLFKRG